MAMISEGQRPAHSSRVTLDRLWFYLALFTSLGTLVCCALPLLLVMVGLGASAASLFSALPWLVSLSMHKAWVFTIAGALIFGNLVYVYALAPRLKAEGQTCAIDAAPSACDTASRVSRIVLWASAAIWMVGFSAAYLLPLALGV
jgi:mercuric ion transport protein